MEISEELLRPAKGLLGETPDDPKHRDSGGEDDLDGRSRDDLGEELPEGGGRDEAFLRERRAKRQAQRDKSRLERELGEVKQRLDRNEGYVLEERVRTLGGSIATRRSAATTRLQEGMDEHDAAKMAEAQRELAAVDREQAELEASVRAAKAERAAGPSAEQGVSSEAKRWLRDNPWFKEGGEDDDSALVEALSIKLLREGYAADDPEHFKELNRRIAKRMPHLKTKLNKRSTVPDDDDDDDLDLPGGVSPGSRGQSSSERDSRGSTPISQQLVNNWKIAKPDFDPKNKEHVAELRKYHDEVQAKNGLGRRRR
jgi:hypothetical protein